jgi:hypothetical protein
LFAWPGVCIALFVLLPLEAAAVWSMLGGYLLLPSGMTVDVPLLPPIDKMMVAALSTFLLCWMKGTPTQARRPSWLIHLFGFCFVLSPLLTSFTNSYELQTAAGSIPGFYPLDGVKVAGRQLIALLPMFVGMRFLSSDRGRSVLLKSFPTALTMYSLPMLFELRMSPQLHRWVYGYHPNEFQNQMRAGGFRPVVFTEHGLALALFVTLGIIAAVVMARLKWRVLRLPAGAIASYLGALLILCKSLGPFVYAALLTPVVIFTRPRTWVKVSLVAVLIVCAYPALRWHGLIPVDRIAAAAGGVSANRSVSFLVRANNEGQLLAKANEKPILGWGTSGRNRVYDKITGRDLSITDGQWIIQFGTFGWFGYLALFGLLATCVFGAYRSIGRQKTASAMTIGGLTLLLAVQVADMIPNASSMALTFLLAGAIATSAVRASKPTPATVAKEDGASVLAAQAG